MSELDLSRYNLLPYVEKFVIDLLKLDNFKNEEFCQKKLIRDVKECVDLLSELEGIPTPLIDFMFDRSGVQSYDDCECGHVRSDSMPTKIYVSWNSSTFGIIREFEMIRKLIKDGIPIIAQNELTYDECNNLYRGYYNSCKKAWLLLGYIEMFCVAKRIQNDLKFIGCGN